MKLLSLVPVSLRGVACVCLLGLGAGCSEIDVAEQDLALRYLQEEDRVEVEIECRGIFETPSRWGKSEAEGVPKAKERLKEMAGGARQFYVPLSPEPIILDLDKLFEVKEGGWLSEEQCLRFRKLIRESVSVESAMVFLDDLGEVSLKQQFAITSAAACVASLNELVTAGVRDELEDNGDDPIDPTQPYGTQESRDNLRAFVDDGRDWVSLDQKALVVRVPMTSLDLALTLKELVSDTERDQDAGADDWGAARARLDAKAVLGKLKGLSAEDGVVTLRFPLQADGRISWEFHRPRHPDAKKLAAAFDAVELK